MEVKTHQAELCMNELSKCKKSWFDKERFDIINKHMQNYAAEKMSVLSNDLLSQKEANAVLTEGISFLENKNEDLKKIIDLVEKEILLNPDFNNDLIKQKVNIIINNR